MHGAGPMAGRGVVHNLWCSSDFVTCNQPKCMDKGAPIAEESRQAAMCHVRICIVVSILSPQQYSLTFCIALLMVLILLQIL